MIYGVFNVYIYRSQLDPLIDIYRYCYIVLLKDSSTKVNIVIRVECNVFKVIQDDIRLSCLY